MVARDIQYHGSGQKRKIGRRDESVAESLKDVCNAVRLKPKQMVLRTSVCMQVHIHECTYTCALRPPY